MNYGTVIDGVITAPLTMCSNFNGIGAWHTLTDEQRAVHGWFPCLMVNEFFSVLKQVRSERPEMSFDGQTITVFYAISEKSLATIKSELLAALAEHRFNFEVAGLSLGDGLRVQTDRESQAQLSNCFVDLKHGLIPDTDWKGSDWQLVDLEQIEPIAKAVAAHRRGCFRGERLVQAVINDAETVADLEVINISLLFSAAYQKAFSAVMTPEQATE